MKYPDISPGNAVLLSTMLGISIWLPLIVCNEFIGNAPNDAWTLWNWVAYPLILLFSCGFGFLVPTVGWALGPFAILASYIAALFVVPQTGNLLPFEVFWMAMLCVPAALLGRFGARKKEIMKCSENRRQTRNDSVRVMFRPIARNEPRHLGQRSRHRRDQGRLPVRHARPPHRGAEGQSDRLRP